MSKTTKDFDILDCSPEYFELKLKEQIEEIKGYRISIAKQQKRIEELNIECQKIIEINRQRKEQLIIIEKLREEERIRNQSKT